MVGPWTGAIAATALSSAVLNQRFHLRRCCATAPRRDGPGLAGYAQQALCRTGIAAAQPAGRTCRGHSRRQWATSASTCDICGIGAFTIRSRALPLLGRVRGAPGPTTTNPGFELRIPGYRWGGARGQRDPGGPGGGQAEGRSAAIRSRVFAFGTIPVGRRGIRTLPSRTRRCRSAGCRPGFGRPC